MIKETEIASNSANNLTLVETDDYIAIVVVAKLADEICRTETRLDQIQAIHLRNNISIWANNKRNRDLRKDNKLGERKRL